MHTFETHNVGALITADSIISMRVRLMSASQSSHLLCEKILEYKTFTCITGDFVVL